MTEAEHRGGEGGVPKARLQATLKEGLVPVRKKSKYVVKPAKRKKNLKTLCYKAPYVSLKVSTVLIDAKKRKITGVYYVSQSNSRSFCPLWVQHTLMSF